MTPREKSSPGSDRPPAPANFRAILGGLLSAGLIAVVLYPFVSRGRPDERPGDSSVGSGAVQLVAPAQTARAPVVFEWTGGFTGDWFDLEVTDESGAQVWRTRVTTRRVEAPAGTLEPGRRYRWRVTAWSGRDQRLESASRAFVVAPAR